MIALRYTLFALIATAVNLLSQASCFAIYNGAGALYIAMSFGTLTGLLCKYYLDKNYIFSYKSKNTTDEIFTFSFYSAFGVFTTAIFWITEIAFEKIFEPEFAKYLGACIGLAVGYFVKYQLDKKYVFVSTLETHSAPEKQENETHDL